MGTIGLFKGLRLRFQALSELGPGRAAFRIGHELKLRLGAYKDPKAPPELTAIVARGDGLRPVRALSFESPTRVADVMRARMSAADRRRTEDLAALAAQGKIVAFGKWVADFGNPVDWHLNPTNGERWRSDLSWDRVLRDEARVGDVKLTWEAGRFPQAYALARSAMLTPGLAPAWSEVFDAQVDGFLADNVFPNGAHWNSGQELVIRHIAWCFALSVFSGLDVDVDRTGSAISASLPLVGAHLRAHFEFARRAVYNNHLIAEALGLYLIGRTFPGTRQGDAWRDEGLRELERQATAQFAPDGGYIQNAHNYHRVVLQYYLVAMRAFGQEGRPCPPDICRALATSLDFLVAHQNPADGRLPNFGSNDGSLPLVLSACDFSDMRPTLQAVSLAVRGERIYEPGPWDEESAWLVGAGSLEAPLHRPDRRSVSFASGYSVLRAGDERTFATFRCGSLTDRFAQIDMLAVDLWWRGQNVLVDAGSYLYNGPQVWHEHFMGTASHNTVMVDGADQMVHLRRFTVVGLTKARLLDFRVTDHGTLCTGEHFAYRRLPGRPVHRRSVLLAGDQALVVVDTLLGFGDHEARLHWLCGSFPTRQATPAGPVTLETPEGNLTIHVFDGAGNAEAIDRVEGDESAPRGWVSRYYGEREPAPSLSVTRGGPLPITYVTVVAPADVAVTRVGEVWRVGSGRWFAVREGAIVPLADAAAWSTS